MRLLYLLIVLLSAVTAPAAAADKLAFGPVPAWVVPASVPTSVKGAADAPLQALLVDQQLLLEKGKVTSFTRLAIRIQNAQGLSAGNIAFPWRPAFDAVTVHSLHIVRDGKVIDVLGAGQTFSILRREANLESASLNGVLTATIQPEGLQVGDIIDLQLSVVSADTTLGDQVQQIVGAWNQGSLGRGHVLALWSADLPVRLRFSGDLPKTKIVKRNGLNAIEFTRDDVTPQIAPKSAPARFTIGRALEISSFKSWADVSAAIAPLYEQASVIPPKGALRDEVERIRNNSTDPARRAEAALALVEQRVRYVALNMGEAGMVPARAEETWSRRFGDCKGKTALLLGILHEFGIEAVPVAVNTSAGDAVSDRLPMAVLFNHVLVRARIAGREYWLDGTRIGDGNLASLSVPDFGYGLEIIPAAGKLVRLIVPPLDLPSEDIAIRLDASAGISVPAAAEVEIIYRGDEARGVQAVLAQVPEQLRDQTLRDFWKQKYDFIDASSTTSAFDTAKGEMRLQLKGSARMDWSSTYYETDGTGLGFKPDWDRVPGPLHDVPVAVAYPWYSRVQETIILPRGFTRPTQSIPDIDITLAGIRYSRRASYKENVFSVTSEQRSLVPEISYAQAKTDEKALRDLTKDILYLRVPGSYHATEADLTTMLSAKLTTANQFLDRGNALLNAGRVDDAIKDFDQALVLEPNNAIALADRGIALVWKEDFAAAAKILDAAAAINPNSPIVYRARGLLAEKKGDNAVAIAAFTRSLELDQGNVFALGHRAEVYARSGDEDRALVDSAEALKTSPNWVELRLLRANIFLRRGKPELSQAEAEALLNVSSKEVYNQVIAAAIYSKIGKKAEAAAAYDRALAIKPSAFIYLNRAMQRPKSEVSARTTDIDAALKLEPDNPDALRQKADLLSDEGDWAGVAALLSNVPAKVSSESWPLIARGIALLKLGRKAEAEKDFKAAVAVQPVAGTWNNLCWSKATAGIELESALAECNEALKLAPTDRAILDSRGFVYLRLGKVDAAIADYDLALAKGPISSSLMGRSLALAKKGDNLRSVADRKAAEKIDPDVAERFKAYGLSF